MGTDMLNIAILSSSRADYGIYLPLINKLSKDVTVKLELIAFGTHLSKFHGYTIQNIDKNKFSKVHELEHILANDSPNAISTSYGLISLKFAEFWKNNSYNVVICLGDRYEMAAAVMAGLPYGIKFAHLHGGETTLGAIDNVYRHSITLASDIHFVSTKKNKLKVIKLIDKEEKIYNVGSLSLDNIQEIKLLTKDEFVKKWNIDLNIKTILITIHPETIDFERNEHFANEIYKALSLLSLERQLVITMPNADTSGNIFRDVFNKLKTEKSDKVFLIENFGTQSYFTCMKYSDIVLGNSSSGIIEASSFKKYVINIGDRQKGRESGENIINLPFEYYQIVQTTKKYFNCEYNGENIYYNGGAVDKIINSLKENYG